MGHAVNAESLVRFFTFEQYHNKNNVGSTKIRVHNLIKYWKNSGLYKYGEKPDVLIFQKVYCTYDYKFHKNYKDTIKILDVCDIDWTRTPDIYIKQTLDNVHASVVPTKNLQRLLQTMTDKPVVIIRDRFDLTEFPERKNHKGKARNVVWFGYSHNSTLLRFAVQSLESRGLNLTVISNEDPLAFRWAADPNTYESKYTYIRYNPETIYNDIQQHDVCIMPKGYRPQDRYKSENKTVIAQLCGLPVVSNAEELETMIDAKARNQYIEDRYDKLKQEYDVNNSILEYKSLIKQISDK